jgi:methionine biosynthesis protein MetW
MTEADYDHYWDTRRGETFGAESDWQRDRARIVASVLRGQLVASIIDVGCGDGVFSKYLAEKLNAKEVVGYDMSERAIEAAKKAGVEAHQLDLRDAAARQAIPRADIIVLFEVLEHLAESEEVLKDMYAKANTAVFFSLPNTGFLTHRFRLFFGKFPVQWATSPNEHLRFWTIADMRWWLTELGYANAKIIGYRGVPGLNTLWPNLFAEGMMIFIPRTADHAL